MIWVLASLILAQPGAAPGPLDAFRANRAAIRARMDYTWTLGYTNPSVIDRDSIWSDGVPFREDSDKTILGLWETDGHADHFVWGSSDDVIQRKAPLAKPGQFVPYTLPSEMVYDGEIQAHHPLGLGAISVILGGRPGLLFSTKTPFSWWGYAPFPFVLENEKRGIVPEQSRTTIGGHATEVEIYRRLDAQTGDSDQIEIFYDPSMGYLPRALRRVFLVAKTGRARICQTYLLAAWNTRSGGFVPTEWFDARYAIKDFRAVYPDYRPGMKLSPRDGNGDVTICHFKANKVEDFQGVIKLDRFANLKLSLGCEGGVVSLSPTPKSLTIDEIRKRLGSRLTNPKVQAVPHIDERELRSFVEEPRRGWAPAILMSACIIGCVLAIWGFRRRIAVFFALSLATCCASGCGTQIPPTVKLSAAFIPTSIVYKPGCDRLSVPLVVNLKKGT